MQRRQEGYCMHAGSGVPNIYNTWEDEGWEEPVIIEEFVLGRTTLILSFEKKNSDMDDTEILSDAIWDIVYLIRFKVITYDDLADFSDELKQEVQRIQEMHRG